MVEELLKASGFLGSVTDEFQFLETEYNCRSCALGASQVRYNNGEIAVVITLSKLAEIELFIFRTAADHKSGKGYSLGEIVHAARGREDKLFQPLYFSGMAPGEVKNQLEKMSRIFRRFGVGLIKGETLAWERLVKTKARMNSRRKKIEAASEYRSKNYSKARALYVSMQDELTPLEEKRLEHINKKLGLG